LILEFEGTRLESIAVDGAREVDPDCGVFNQRDRDDDDTRRVRYPR
jgi:hypothetical protein